MNFYPEQLRRIADICDALNEVDGVDVKETEGVTLQLDSVKLVDEYGTDYGTFRDEVGGSWSFDVKP